MAQECLEAFTPAPDEQLTTPGGSEARTSQLCKSSAFQSGRSKMFDVLAWGFLGMTTGMFALLLFLAWEHHRNESR